MKIQLLAFGQIAEITGKTAREMSGILDTNELIKILEEEFPVLAKTKFSIAVNKKIIQGNTVVNQNDTIALLPPFSGG